MKTETLNPDWDEPIAIQLTPHQIDRCCFQSGDTFCIRWEPIDNYADEDCITELIHVESEVGSCRLFFMEGFEKEPIRRDIYQHAIELRIGDVYLQSFYEPDPATLHHADVARLAEEDFIRACTLLGEKVTFRPVHHRLTEE